MMIKGWIPEELHPKLDAIYYELQTAYFWFNPLDVIHQMFAANILLLRELAEKKKTE